MCGQRYSEMMCAFHARIQDFEMGGEMHTSPRNSADHTLFLFFASFTRSKSALYHLHSEATCSLGTDKQLGNVTSVVEYSKIVTAQQLGDGTVHGSGIFHVSNIHSCIEETYSNDNLN